MGFVWGLPLIDCANASEKTHCAGSTQVCGHSHVYELLNPILMKAEGFVEVPKVRTECAIINFKPGDHIQYKTHALSRIAKRSYSCGIRVSLSPRSLTSTSRQCGMRELRNSRRGTRVLGSHPKLGRKKKQEKGWSSGSAKRSKSAPVASDERKINPVEKPLAWRDLLPREHGRRLPLPGDAR